MLTVLATWLHGGITCPYNYEARIVSSQLPTVKKTSPTPYFEEDDDGIITSADN